MTMASMSPERGPAWADRSSLVICGTSVLISSFSSVRKSGDFSLEGPTRARPLEMEQEGSASLSTCVLSNTRETMAYTKGILEALPVRMMRVMFSFCRLISRMLRVRNSSNCSPPLLRPISCRTPSGSRAYLDSTSRRGMLWARALISSRLTRMGAKEANRILPLPEFWLQTSSLVLRQLSAAAWSMAGLAAISCSYASQPRGSSAGAPGTTPGSDSR